jgi:hypothetical protein
METILLYEHGLLCIEDNFILFLPAMYIYYVYHATSKSPKDSQILL